jgi:GNAT superfamily N-acetyltransferase
MQLSATAVPVTDILPWRPLYQEEMSCQIIHDSIHTRAGWTESWLLHAGANVVGYGISAVSGPWKGTKTALEFYVTPEHRTRVFDLFSTFAAAAGITAVETQTNDVQLTLMLHAHCQPVSSEKIIFMDQLTTILPAHGARLRRVRPEEKATLFSHRDEPVGEWALELNNTVIATGGILYHYNRPYGDIYMEVDAPFRRRGFGSYLVQELKRVCRESDSVPCARCSPGNFASRQTIQKAGFIPCAHLLTGPISSR